MRLLLASVLLVGCSTVAPAKPSPSDVQRLSAEYRADRARERAEDPDEDAERIALRPPSTPPIALNDCYSWAYDTYAYCMGPVLEPSARKRLASAFRLRSPYIVMDAEGQRCGITYNQNKMRCERDAPTTGASLGPPSPPPLP